MKPENATRLCSTVQLTCMWLIVRLFHMHISYDYDFVYKVLVPRLGNFTVRKFRSNARCVLVVGGGGATWCLDSTGCQCTAPLVYCIAKVGGRNHALDEVRVGALLLYLPPAHAPTTQQ